MSENESLQQRYAEMDKTLQETRKNLINIERYRQIDLVIMEYIFGLPARCQGQMVGNDTYDPTEWVCDDENCSAIFDSTKFWKNTTADHARVPLDYSQSIACAWRIVLWATAKMGYQHTDLRWEGPQFKPEHHYINPSMSLVPKTEQIGGLGEACWYTIVHCNGFIQFCVAENECEAICMGGIALYDELNGTEIFKALYNRVHGNVNVART